MLEGHSSRLADESLVLQQREHPLRLPERLTDTVKAALDERFGTFDGFDVPRLFDAAFIAAEQPMVAVAFPQSELVAKVQQNNAPTFRTVMLLTADEARRLSDELNYTLSLGTGGS